MNEDLKQWCEQNTIMWSEVDDEVIDILGFGKAFVEDTEPMDSIFRLDKEGNIKFNSMENPEELINDDIYYIILKFGDNWYWTDLRCYFKLNILKYVGTKAPYKTTDAQDFVNLGIHSPFELLNGSFALSEWVKKAKYLDQKAIGICDKNTMAATLILQKECVAAGIKFVFGYSLDFVDDSGQKVGAKVYCQTKAGMQNMFRVQKIINVDSVDKTISISDLLSKGNGNVIVFDKYSSNWLVNNQSYIEEFDKAFNSCYYQLDLSEYKAERIDIKVLESTKMYFDELYDEFGDIISPVLIQDCYYLDKDDAKNKIILNKIASGAAHEQSNDQYFKNIDEHLEMFYRMFDEKNYDIKALFVQSCANTVKIADGASAMYETDRNFMPQYIMTKDEVSKYGDRHNMFIKLLEDGFNKLVPKDKQEIYRSRLTYETYILESTNNIDYMLVQYDTVNWARSVGILVGCGRGSAGGCLVLYLLGITLIDPIKYDLIFERFLLPERAGLYNTDTTIIGSDIQSSNYMEVKFDNNRTYSFDIDAQLIVSRYGEDKPIILYADELQEGDEILFDSKDALFTINEI